MRCHDRALLVVDEPIRQTQPPLWQLAIELTTTDGAISEPWGRDRARMEALLAELYLVGERPARRDVRAFMRLRWAVQSQYFQDAILGAWSRRLSRPLHTPRSITAERGWPWAYPFLHLEAIVQEHRLEPIGPRLLRVLTVAAGAYLGSAEDAPGSDESLEAERALQSAAQALRVWGWTRDRDPDWTWSARVFALPRQRFNIATRRGRADHGDWLARPRRHDEAEFPAEERG